LCPYTAARAPPFLLVLILRAGNIYTTNSNVNNLQLAKRIFFKLLNEISPNSQAKHLQLAKNMQKNLHISIIFVIPSDSANPAGFPPKLRPHYRANYNLFSRKILLMRA